jgi:hypothetical protein
LQAWLTQLSKASGLNPKIGQKLRKSGWVSAMEGQAAHAKGAQKGRGLAQLTAPERIRPELVMANGVILTWLRLPPASSAHT